MKCITITCLAAITALFTLAVADTPTSPYLDVSVLSRNDSGFQETGTTGGCYLSYGAICSGSYFESDKESGIRVGGLLSEAGDLEYQLLYRFSLSKEGTQDYLVGEVYSLKLGTDGRITGGERKNIRQPIRYGEQDTLPISDTWGLAVTVYKQAPLLPARAVSGQLVLISVQEDKGETIAAAGNASRLSQERTFTTNFSNLHDSVYQRAQYEATIRFSKPVRLSDLPVHCAVTFERTYRVDTLYFPYSSFEPDVVYRSEYQRDIAIERDKSVQLVFPPDTPSVRGFDILDTLIIAPLE
jgi:hypothetical protein